MTGHTNAHARTHAHTHTHTHTHTCLRALEMQRNGKRLINDSAVFTAQCTKTTHRPTHRRHQSRKGRTVLFLLKVGGGTPWGTCPLSRRESPLVPQNCGRLYIPETPEEFRLSRETFTPILSERYRLSLHFYSQSGALYSRASVHGIQSVEESDRNVVVLGLVCPCFHRFREY